MHNVCREASNVLGSSMRAGPVCMQVRALKDA